MSLPPGSWERIDAILAAGTNDFLDLVRISGLDPQRAFRHADLRHCDLRGADLRDFDFTGADLDGTDVRGTDFRHTLGLTREMLRNAVVDATTQWPPEIREAMQAQVRRAQARTFWPDGRAPSWVDDWGTDEYGRWVTFSVPAADGMVVSQRMRWIPPGKFMMGTDEEDGRFDDEGPRHEVTIADGFWLFDTACTEALWQAVTGQEPAARRGAESPVTGVSWDDAQRFIAQLNAARLGLELSLPSEARWEYACRAGTGTPYSFGTEISRDLVCYEADAPVPVGSLPPNRWGLHEMHGNVWEWCGDDWHDGYVGAPDDGSAWLDRRRAASRVVRGGSWFVVARYVRAACRRHVDPSFRNDTLGFRCARVQSASPAVKAKRRAGRSKPGERSEPAATTSP